MAFKMDSTDSLKTAIRTNISYIPIYKIHSQLIYITSFVRKVLRLI
jgi:hypothetical protein